MAAGRYLGLFTSDKAGPKWRAWRALTPAEQDARAQAGVAAVKAWEAAHRDVIDYVGGPLGPTLRLDDTGALDATVNLLTVFIVVRADSPEAAARLLADHPHITHFVCDGVEVMPVLGD